MTAPLSPTAAGRLHRVAPTVWELPRDPSRGMRVPARVFADEGYGFPVGGSPRRPPPDGVVSPGAVGYDINCGVRLLALPVTAEELSAPVREALVPPAPAVPLRAVAAVMAFLAAHPGRTGADEAVISDALRDAFPGGALPADVCCVGGRTSTQRVGTPARAWRAASTPSSPHAAVQP